MIGDWRVVRDVDRRKALARVTNGGRSGHPVAPSLGLPESQLRRRGGYRRLLRIHRELHLRTVQEADLLDGEILGFCRAVADASLLRGVNYATGISWKTSSDCSHGWI